MVASGTKALTGHSDLLLGYVATRDTVLLERLTSLADPRPARSRAPSTPGWRTAHWPPWTCGWPGRAPTPPRSPPLLAQRPDVSGLRWPGLPGDPSYAVAARQMRRIPGIVSFDLGSAERVGRFLGASRLIAAATSFGGVHTSADRREQWGDDTPPGFVRLSCGVEDTADLVADLRAALDASR